MYDKETGSESGYKSKISFDEGLREKDFIE